MDRQTPGQLFLSIFLRTLVVTLGIGICILLIALLTHKVKNKNDGDEPQPNNSNVLTEVDTHDDNLMNTTEQTPSTEENTEEPTPEYEDSFDKNILVLNSTDKIGFAGGWCTKLNGYGYTNTTASDYSYPLTTTKIVAKQDGVGKDLLQYFNNPVYEVGVVTEGTSFDAGVYDIVIILGTADITE